MMSDLNLSHGKIPDFVSYSLLGFTLAIKLRNFDFESLWNTLIFYFDQSKCNVRFKYVQWNMSDVVSFPLFGFTLVIKLRTFDFESRWNILTLFTIWGGEAHCARGRFFPLLWQQQGSWESGIFRKFLKFIKVSGLKTFF